MKIFDLIVGNFEVNEANRTIYNNTLRIVEQLQNDGICTYTADDVNIPFEMHSICITWQKNGDFIEPPLRELKKLCDMSDLTIITEEGNPFWQFTIEIYSEIEDPV